MDMIKKGGASQNEGIIVINQGGPKKKIVIKRPGQQKKVMSPGVPGGMGSEQFYRRIINHCISFLAYAVAPMSIVRMNVDATDKTYSYLTK